MGGSGGGASGAVSYPTYMTVFHNRILDNTGADTPGNSFIDAYNVAYGNSPFASAVAFNPSTELSSAITIVGGFNTTVGALNHLTDWTDAFDVAAEKYIRGTTTLDTVPDVTVTPPLVPAATPIANTPSTLDTSALDTTTLDSITVTEGDIAADVAAMEVILNAALEQGELPRFRAGMLNINAVHSSAYIIGEALLRAEKDRNLAKYATDLAVRVNEQVREINARHALSFREITARLQTSQKEINSRHSISRREIDARDIITTKEINARNLIAMTEVQAKEQESYRNNVTSSQGTQRELNARHQISKKELDAKYYMHQYELIRMSTTQMLADLMKKVEFSYQHAHLNAEVRRMAITAHKEEVEEQLAIEESDAKWDLELFRYAGNLLAGPSGGVAQGTEKKSKAVSALGGAISGAATGAVVGSAFGGVGAAPGAAIGAVAGVGLALLS